MQELDESKTADINFKIATILARKGNIYCDVNIASIKKNSVQLGAFCFYSLQKFNGTEDIYAKKGNVEKYSKYDRRTNNESG